jgi:hypothetical protein
LVIFEVSGFAMWNSSKNCAAMSISGTPKGTVIAMA